MANDKRFNAKNGLSVGSSTFNIVDATGNITANTISGNGQNITSINATSVTTGTLPYAQIPANVTNTTANFSISGAWTFNANVTFGAADHIVLSSTSGVSANGSYGTAGHVLHSNGTAVYWAADDNTIYDLTTIANTTASNAILRLSDSNSTNDNIFIIGTGTTVTSSNATHIIINTADQFVGTVTSVASGNGLTGGPVTTTGTISILANTGIVANATGTFVNSAYIATISANNATYFDTATWAAPKALGTGTANSGAFTTVTASTSVSVGSNVSMSTSQFTVGNTTANSSISSTLIRFSSNTRFEQDYAAGTGTISGVFGYHPESYITNHPFLTNDLANLRRRGGTFGANTNIPLSNTQFDLLFDSTPTYLSGGWANTVANTVLEFTNIPTLFWGAGIGISFGNAAWAPSSLSIEAFSNGVWVSCYSNTAFNAVQVFAPIPGNAGPGTTALRFTMGANSTSRIAHIWGYDYDSDGWSQAAMPRAGGQFYGNVSVNSTSQFAVGTTIINATSFTGTANNATYLNGQLASFYTNATNITTGTLPYAQIPANVTNTTANFSISGAWTFNANVTFGAADHIVLSSTSGISANGSYGTASHVLHTNGSAVYWAADDNTTYDLLAVANTVVNAGLLRLSDSSLSNDTVTFTGTGAATVLSNTTHIIINANDTNETYVIKNIANTIANQARIQLLPTDSPASNTTAVFVGGGTTTVSANTTALLISTADQFVGTVTSVASGNGLTGGPITSTGTVSILANTGIVANATGTFVNSAYIATISANAATFSNTITVADTRSVNTTPETVTGPQVRFDFKANATDNLTDGGTYFGEMTFRPYGSGTDWTGGPSHQLGFTANNNLYHRSGTSTTWGTWGRLYKEGTTLTPGNTVVLGSFGLSANGGFGTAGQVLHSNGTATFWAVDDNTTYDLLAVANTAVNAGLLRLSDSSLSNDTVTFTGTGTSIASSNATHVIINSSDQFVGTVTSVATANGLSGGTITTSGTLGVTTGSTLTVNTTGIHVNSALSITSLAAASNIQVGTIGVSNGASVSNSLIFVGNNTVYSNITPTSIFTSTGTFARTLANNEWDAITIANRGSWSTALGKGALINVTDSDTVTNTVGKFGIVYDSTSRGAFVVRNLYNSSTYGSSGDVLYARGDGSVGIGTSSPISGAGVTVGNDGSGSATVKYSFSTSTVERAFISMNGGTGELRSSAGYAVYGGFSTFYTVDTERMRIAANGNIGIGSTAPGVKLEVTGSIRASQSVTIGTSGTYEAGSIYSDANWGMIFRAKQASPVSAEFSWRNSADSGLMVINTSGQLGIGTTAPQYRLDVNSGSAANNIAASFGSTITAGQYAGIHFGYSEAANQNYRKSAIVFEREDGSARGKIHILNDGAADGGSAVLTDSKVTIQYDGNVGIGTTTPGTSLQVNGGIRARGGAPGALGVNNNGYSFTGNSGDNDGGMFSSADGQIEFYTDSTEKMRIVANGNVGIATITPGYKLEVNGSFAATTKSFVIDHPTKLDMKLRYGSLEGPENGVYIRGRLRGSNTIDLPDYWTGLVDEDTITVNLTAVRKSQNLYVSELGQGFIRVDGETVESIDCFYTIYGERKDVEKLVVEF